MSLDALRIVLLQPSHPGNIGGVARAMKNMGLSQLCLVSPRAFPHPEAAARAAGADEVLAQAKVCASLDEAIADCALVIGTSDRQRAIPWPNTDPPGAARLLVEAADKRSVALIFGPERTGMTNEQLDRCHYLVQIPANPTFSSLNLVCAVQVMAYEIWCAALDRAAPSEPPGATAAPTDLASQADLQRFFAHLEQVLVEIDFLDPDNPRKLMRRLMRLFARTRLDNNEINILRGILTAVQQLRWKNT